jgi:hypothetical protein
LLRPAAFEDLRLSILLKEVNDCAHLRQSKDRQR